MSAGGPDRPASEADDDATDPELLASLADDFAARHRRGERPSIEDYAAGHPGIADEIRDLFPAMVLLEEPGVSPLADPAPAAERLGAAVGRYKLLERLGEGGFGVVFLAEQLAPVRRKVALKVIKPGLDTRQVIARFEAERQALAMMDHENIARVLDAGATDTGRPYFVMELVRGVPITEYCDANRLAARRRLELFVQVCRAIQHAHTKGVIHRDLKPTNVLVAVHDGHPVPKVIDFGVAKATAQQQLADGTLFTNLAQIVGTPLYMSPEQAEMSGRDVDTRSDVYSLGVLLYELLTGTTPVDKDRLKQAGFDEVRRIIREEEPPRPSTRISTRCGALPAGSVGARGDLKKLGQLVRGELDWIVMKALEKDRARRYETVSGLAADVERYLKGEAVHACPPSATYLAKKVLRRHKGPVIAASLVAAALVAGMIGTAWGVARARVVAAEKVVAEIAARNSAREALDQQYQKLLGQARFQRVSGRVGQRFDALKTIALARQIRVTSELRNEAAAALALPDIELAQEWPDTDPTGALTISFDGPVIHYARVNQQGAVSVGRVTNGREEPIALGLPSHGHSIIRGPWWSDDRRFLAYAHSGVDATQSTGLRVLKLDGTESSVVLDEPAGVCLTAFAFRSDGRKCAAAHPAGDVSVYDLGTGKGNRLPVGKVEALAFHPRDERLAVAFGNSVRVLDSNIGTLLKTLRLDQLKSADGIRCIAWHPDGCRIAVACRDTQIHVLDVESGAEILPPFAGRAEFEMIAFNREGDRLLSRDWQLETKLWDVASRSGLLTTRGFVGDSTVISPDDQLVGFSRERGKIQVWQVAWGRELRVLGRPGAVGSWASPELDASGRILASARADRLCFFDITSGEELASVAVPHEATRPFGFDPAGAWFTGGTRGVMLWPLRSDPGRPESLHVGPPQQLASGDGSEARAAPITTANDRFKAHGVTVWHVPFQAAGVPPEPAGAGTRPAPPPQPLLSGFASSLWGYSGASRDGRVVAIADHSSTILIHRDRADAPLTLGPQAGVGTAPVSPDGRWVASGSGFPDDKSKLIRIWDGRDGRHVIDLPLSGEWGRGRFSPDSNWFASETEEGFRLWKVGQWDRAVRPYSGEFVFSPDSRLIAVADVVGCIRLVETATDREVARVSGPEPVVYKPRCFTPDGTRLIATRDATYVWDLRLIREQLREKGLDWDWESFPAGVPDPRGRLHLTIDTGIAAPEPTPPN